MILLYVPEARGSQFIDLPAVWSVLLEFSNDLGLLQRRHMPVSMCEVMECR